MLKTTISLLVLFFIFTMQHAHAQAESHDREVGFGLNGGGNYELVIKKARTKENRYLVLIPWLNANLSVRGSAFSRTFGSFNLGLGVGFEKRKRLSDKLVLNHGFLPFVGIGVVNLGERSFSTASSRTLSAAQVGLNYMLGAQYQLFDDIAVGVGFRPGIGVSFGLERSAEFFSQASSSNASLSILYTFGKKKKDK